GPAQERAGHRGGAGPGQEPDRGGHGFPGRLDPPPGVAPGTLRGDRGLRAQGQFHRPDPRGHRGGPDAGSEHMVRAGQEEHRRPAAEGMTSPRVVRLVVLLLVVLSPTFPQAEVTRKISEIRAAIKRSDEDPNAIAGRVLSRLLFPGHPYGVPVEGTQESVGRLTRDDVVKFQQEVMRPDTTVIA